MSSNKYADEFFATHMIKYGVGEGQENLDTWATSTNRAAHEANNFLQRPEGLHALIVGILRAPEFKTTQQVWDVLVEYQNQPEGSHVTETALQNVVSTNGQVYRNGGELAALRKEVAELKTQLSEILALLKKGDDNG